MRKAAEARAAAVSFVDHQSSEEEHRRFRLRRLHGRRLQALPEDPDGDGRLVCLGARLSNLRGLFSLDSTDGRRRREMAV